MEAGKIEAMVTPAIDLPAIAEGLPALVFVTDRQGDISFINQRLASYAGLGSPAPSGWSWLELLHREDRQRAESLWTQSLASGESYALECRLQRHDGEFRWHRCQASPQRDPHGELKLWLGTCFDIHAGKRHEALLQESEERFSRVFLASPNGLAITTREEGLIREVNERYLEIFQLRREEVIGRRSIDLGLIKPADRARALRILAREGRLRDFEIRIDNRPGGSLHLLISMEPVDIQGEPHLVTKFHDISRLKQSEEQLRRTLESIGDGFCAFDEHWRFIYVNSAAERIMHKERSQLLGRCLWDVIPEVRGSELEDNYRAAANGQAREFEYFYSAWGRWFHHRCFPREGGGMSLYFQDVSERNRAEQALREADRRKDEFLAVLAHELRNPLAPLRSGLELLQRRWLREGDGARLTGMMQRQLDHLVRLVDDLLDLSRISRGKISLRREQLELREVLEAAMETAAPLINERRHRLTVRHAEGPLPMLADFERLSQVISNLLSNAAKYTPEGGAIELGTDVRDGEVLIRVADSGLGIPPGREEEIFQMFTQVAPGGQGNQGLGIGLAIARQLLDLHGGSISARSAGIGKGSEFLVRLPMSSLPLDLERPRQAPPRSAPPPRRILVVDDNHDAARSLGMLLQLQGHLVEVTDCGKAALARHASFRPDIILLDIGMPEMDGYEVARRLRLLPGGERPLLVAVTGWGQDQDKRLAREAGFDAHLTKPVGTETLNEIIARPPRADLP